MEGKGLGIVFLSSDLIELVSRLNLLHLEQIAGNDSKILNQGILAIVAKLLEYGCLKKENHASFIKKAVSEV